MNAKLSVYSFDIDLLQEHIHPEKTSDPSALNDEAYKVREVDEINHAKEMIRKTLTVLTFCLLRELGFDEEKCKSLADLAMKGELDVKINVIHVKKRNIPRPYEPQFYRYWKDLQNLKLLLISAPEIGNADDPREHKEEMENFCLQAFSLGAGTL